MDNKDNQQPISDDQELAKVLTGDSKKSSMPKTLDDLQFEESPLPTPSVTPASVSPDAASASMSAASVAPTSTPTADPISSTPVVGGLDAIKKDALEELRPLATKLNLPADEKFDTLLLIIRSTDDQSLLGAAHEAAKSIEDESRRAQALLDVIKEIDYFSGQK